MTHHLQQFQIFENCDPNLIKSITLFASHTCPDNNIPLTESAIFVTSTKNVYSIGTNLYGQLGCGHQNYASTPQKISILCNLNIVYIDITHWNAVAITDSGRAYLWGSGRTLGDDKIIQKFPICINELIGGNRVVQLKFGYTHVIILTENGKVYTWGYNEKGNGKKCKQILPGRVLGKLEKLVVKEISCGGYHNLALVDNGGQLGINSTKESRLPKRVVYLKNIKKISCGEIHSMALDRNGCVHVWGCNSSSQLGIIRCKKQIVPCRIYDCLKYERIIDIVCQWDLSLAQTNGCTFMWGELPQLLDDEYQYTTPTRVPNIKTIDLIFLTLCKSTCRPFKPSSCHDFWFLENLYNEKKRENFIDVFITCERRYTGKRYRE